MPDSDAPAGSSPGPGGGALETASTPVGNLLQRLPFFSELSYQAAQELARLTAAQRYEPNRTLFTEGDCPDSLYILLSGAVRIFKTDYLGAPVEQALQVDADSPRGLALLDGAVLSLSVHTAESCQLFILPRREFLDFLSRFPRRIPRWFASLHRELRILNEQLLCDALEGQAQFVESERERHRALTQIPMAAGEATSVENAMQIAVDRVCSCLGWPVGHVYMVEEDSPHDLFSSSIWHLRSPQQFEPFRQISDLTHFGSGVGLPGQVLASGKTVWMEDISQTPASRRATTARQVGLRAGCGIPVLVGKQVMAVLEFFSLEAAQRDELLMETLAAIAVQLGRMMEHKRYEGQLLHNAFHDALTGLPNRALFLDRLGLSLARAKRHPDYLFAVLFLDLDRFKVINDSLGHLLGDRALAEVGRRLQTVLRATDSVARFGGDEFAILLDDLGDISNVPRTVERVRQELQSPIKLADREVFTSASIGVVLSTAEYSRPEDILQDADIALYHSKAQGRGRHVIFDASMRDHAVRILQLETGLRMAMDRQELRLFYQPIVSLEDCRVVGFEALLRWQHPERGILPAGEFLPIAEETEMILPMSQWILRQVSQQLRLWQRQFPANPPLSVSVNLTTKYLGKPGLLEEITALVVEHGLEPGSLKLEITESQIMDDPEAVSKTLLELSKSGVQVYIDDFGTGYSSLSYLSKFPARALKIDQSFVNTMNSDDKNAAIVRAVVALGRSLGLDVIAEGVETAQQLESLRAAKCHYGQGYYFCRPVEPESAARLMVERVRLDGEVPVDASRLRAFDLFDGLNDTERCDVAQMTRQQSVNAGAIVIREGQVGKEIYLLEEGSVEIFHGEPDAAQFVARLQAPAFFGERALLDPERVRTASVRAVSDLRVLCIRIDSFLGLLRRFPSLRQKVRASFVERT